MMQWVTLDSSAINAVAYDEVNRTLDVEFREGHSHRYMRVPEFVCRELLNADSAGVFLNAVKGQFEYVKLG